MLSSEQLDQLVIRLGPRLQGICTEDRLKELLGKYEQAYPNLEPTDELDHGLQPGSEVWFKHPGTNKTAGILLAGLRRSTRNHSGVEWIPTHLIVQIDQDRHIRVDWKNVRHPRSEHPEREDAS